MMNSERNRWKLCRLRVRRGGKRRKDFTFRNLFYRSVHQGSEGMWIPVTVSGLPLRMSKLRRNPRTSIPASELVAKAIVIQREHRKICNKAVRKFKQVLISYFSLPQISPYSPRIRFLRRLQEQRTREISKTQKFSVHGSIVRMFRCIMGLQFEKFSCAIDLMGNPIMNHYWHGTIMIWQFKRECRREGVRFKFVFDNRGMVESSFN